MLAFILLLVQHIKSPATVESVEVTQNCYTKMHTYVVADSVIQNSLEKIKFSQMKISRVEVMLLFFFKHIVFSLEQKSTLSSPCRDI